MNTRDEMGFKSLYLPLSYIGTMGVRRDKLDGNVMSGSDVSLNRFGEFIVENKL